MAACPQLIHKLCRYGKTGAGNWGQAAYFLNSKP